MEKKEILEKIEEIKKEVSSQSCDIIRNKIHEREYQIFKPNRLRFLGRIIGIFRKRFAKELDHALGPVLENQKEINLRLLKEIEDLKKLINKSDETKSEKAHSNPEG